MNNHSILASALADAGLNTLELEPATLTMKLAGQYRIVLNEGTDREVDTGWFDNLVVNAGLDRLGQVTAPAVFSFGCIGTGTATPANTDTSLQAWVASSSNLTVDSESNSGVTPYVAQCQMHWVYAQGAVVGNMAEVGVGWATGGGSLFSRARILDGGGSPTTLTVTSLDQLTQYYKLTCTPSVTDITGTVVLSAVSYTYTGRLAQSASFLASLYSYITGSGPWGKISSGSTGQCSAYPSTSTLGAVTSTPSGTSITGGTSSAVGYTIGNYYLDSTLSIPPADCNVSGGIACLMIPYQSGRAFFQYSFSPVIPKDNTKTMTMVFRYAWSR